MTDFTTGRRKKGWMNLRVTDVIHETHDTDTFLLVDADDGGRQFDYIAGQYLTFRFDDVSDKPVVRSYTMSSSPCQPEYSAVTVKRVEKGLISNWLCDHVKTGTILRARGPIGRFVYESDKDAPHLFMVAAGSGVTPFISILREYAPRLGQADAPQKMTLVVSYRSKADLICWKELESVRQIPGVNVIVTLSRENLPEEGFWHGRINDAMLSKVIAGAYAECTFMSCGPQAIMDLVSVHCKAHGVAETRVKTESFEG